MPPAPIADFIFAVIDRLTGTCLRHISVPDSSLTSAYSWANAIIRPSEEVRLSCVTPL